MVERDSVQTVGLPQVFLAGASTLAGVFLCGVHQDFRVLSASGQPFMGVGIVVVPALAVLMCMVQLAFVSPLAWASAAYAVVWGVMAFLGCSDHALGCMFFLSACLTTWNGAAFVHSLGAWSRSRSGVST